MSNCRETDPVFICFTPADTNIAPVTLLQHVVYEEGRAIGHVITTPTDMLTEIDPATHLGGGSIVAGACAVPETTTTGLDTQVMLGALSAPAAPADTREVTVQNYSAATIRISTSIGDQVVGPNGVIEFGARADEPALTLAAATVVTGTFGLADLLIFNYRTEA